MSKSDIEQRSLPIVQMRGALDQLIQTLPKAHQIPAIKACLAQKIIVLAAGGECNLRELQQRSLQEVRDNCVKCMGCEGLTLPRDRLPISEKSPTSLSGLRVSDDDRDNSIPGRLSGAEKAKSSLGLAR
jgi:hypothetical protein